MSLLLRCIPDTAHCAAFNMAADLYFMEKCVGTQCIFFRTYTWNPAAITIGSMQRASTQLDLYVLKENGIDWVRRPTGGRAVLHCNDITYSCIFPRSCSEMGATVEDTYAIMMKCLVAGFNYAGIVPEIHDSSDPLIKSGRHVKLPCFLAPNRNEIMIGGRKLVGSAQYRSKTAVLQHGSIPMTPQGAELPHYLQIEAMEKELQAELLRKKSISIAQVNELITKDMLVGALQRGFLSIIGCKFQTEPLHDDEIAAIECLMRSDRFRKRWLTDPAD
jgi:lipoate-protein ligase A